MKSNGERHQQRGQRRWRGGDAVGSVPDRHRQAGMAVKPVTFFWWRLWPSVCTIKIAISGKCNKTKFACNAFLNLLYIKPS